MGRTRPNDERALELARLFGINIATWNYTAGQVPASALAMGEKVLADYIRRGRFPRQDTANLLMKTAGCL